MKSGLAVEEVDCQPITGKKHSNQRERSVGGYFQEVEECRFRQSHWRQGVQRQLLRPPDWIRRRLPADVEERVCVCG